MRRAAPRGIAAAELAAVLVGLVGAVALRAGATRMFGTPAPATGIAFAASLLAVAAAAGWRPARPRWRDAAAGLGGGVALVAVPLLAAPPAAPRMAALHITAAVLAWAAVVAVVGVAEEALFRGVLQPRLAERFGVVPGVILTAALFGLLHVPFYGWGALPVDVAAGIWLGWLRQATGSVTAPAVAHVIADWSTWLLR